MLSGVMMLEYLGWTEAAEIATKAVQKTIKARTVTGDLARFMKTSTKLSTSDFAQAVVGNMVKPRRRSGKKTTVVTPAGK